MAYTARGGFTTKTLYLHTDNTTSYKGYETRHTVSMANAKIIAMVDNFTRHLSFWIDASCIKQDCSREKPQQAH